MPGGLATAQRDRLIGAGAYRHRATVQQPGTPAADGDGGFTQGWTDADPATWFVSLGTAGRAAGETGIAGTTIATAQTLVRGRYRADVTTKTRLVVDGRVFNVLDARDLDARHRILELVCTEVVP
jgi:SPP1 family predicted phage head-tail adaptor